MLRSALRGARRAPSESEDQSKFIIAWPWFILLGRPEHIGPNNSQSVSYNVVSNKMNADRFVFGPGAFPKPIHPKMGIAMLGCAPGGLTAQQWN